MPKMKTKSSAKKRFKLTGTGKIKRKHAFKSHILTKKSKKRKLKLTHSGLVHENDVKSIKHAIAFRVNVIQLRFKSNVNPVVGH